MVLREHFERSGAWLFSHRDYLPLVPLLIILPTLRNFHHAPGSWEYFCFAIGVLGLIVRTLTVGFAAEGTSGRIRRGQEAASLNTTGMYSIVRHPLYLANYLTWLSVVLLTRSAWAVIVVSLIFWLYYERIMSVEEAFLEERFGGFFRAWADRVPAFLPRLNAWQKSTLHFDWRRVLRQERSSLLGLITLFTIFNVFANYRMRHAWVLDGPWLLLFVVALAFYAAGQLAKR